MNTRSNGYHSHAHKLGEVKELCQAQVEQAEHRTHAQVDKQYGKRGCPQRAPFFPNDTPGLLDNEGIHVQDVPCSSSKIPVKKPPVSDAGSFVEASPDLPSGTKPTVDTSHLIQSVTWKLNPARRTTGRQARERWVSLDTSTHTTTGVEG